VSEDPGNISSPRLELVSVGLDFVRAALEGRMDDAERLAGVKLPDGWERDAQSALRYRKAQMEVDPSTRPWLLRLIVIRETGEVAGYVNFHAPPGDEGWVEIGYEIQPRLRRRGYATEAAYAMFLWAGAQGVERLRASVSPDNEPSLGMVQKMGFTRTGEQWDEIDGLEYVFEASLSTVRAAIGVEQGDAGPVEGIVDDPGTVSG
jgi:RimJ/RimL family protein N-acetyltransferase